MFLKFLNYLLPKNNNFYYSSKFKLVIHEFYKRFFKLPPPIN